MSWILKSGALFLLAETLLMGCCRGGTPTPSATQSATPQQRHQDLVNSIGEVEAFEHVSLDNSFVRVRSTGVNRVVDEGLPIMPALLRKMEDESTDFDTFVRCYSAADQILENNGVSDPVFWTGRASLWQDAKGLSRFESAGQSPAFRQKVIADIRAKMALISRPSK